MQVTIPDDSTTKDYDEFTINWGSGVTSKIAKSTNMVASYTYPATANTASITVTGSVSGQSLNCSKPAAALVLSATNLSAVSIRKVTVRNDGFVDVLVKGSQGATAEIQVKDTGGSFRNTGQLMTSNDTNTITVRNIDALKNSYCFRLSANDGCDNAATTSDEVCSVNLEVVAKNGQNDLTWQEYPTTSGNATFQSYRFTRNGASLGTSITNRTTTSQSDRNIICNEQFCYQMTVALAGGIESISSLRCVKAISDETPSLVRNAFVNVLDEQKIEIRSDPPSSGTTPAKFKTIFLRAEEGSNDFKEIAVKDNSLTFQDETANVATKSYCYKIQYENSCGNRSQPTAAICSIQLYSKTNSSVDWTPETPFLAPVNRYELEILDEQGNLVQQIPVGGNTTFDPSAYNPDQQLFRYRILAYAQGTPRISYSNFFVFTRDPVIFIPDAFSPNGDMVNDSFGPKGQFVDKSRLIVYNRWGQVLYETNNATQGWDGTLNGQPAVEGTYVYRIEITDSLGQNFIKTGTVLLVR
ncbi:MAG: gliding motility-associated C-terminal domain-containing protein [Spirosomataceae bacterium]